MTERIDHAAEAQKHIDWAHEQQSMEGQFDETVQHNATLAVAEATLALVEQQRIANLIAISALNFRDADFTKLWNAEGDTEEWRTVRDQVAGGLGLS